jgi:hypothetical protein
MHMKTIKFLIAIILGVILLSVVWYLASPLFLDEEVNETFPFDAMTEEEYAELSEMAEDLDMSLPTLDEMQDMSSDEVGQLEENMQEKSADMPDTVLEEEMSDEEMNTIELILQGNFQDADSAHKGEGSARIYQLTDNSHLLRFEDFEVTNGPDLRVLLVKHENPSSRSNLDEGYVELARLKGNVGDQNYEIPDNVDISEYHSVVIYCKPFHVLFSIASLN